MSEKTRKQYKLPFVTSRPISRNQYCRLTYGFRFSCARSHIYTYQLFMCEPGNIQHTKLYIYTYQLFMCEHGNIQHTKLYIYTYQLFMCEPGNIQHTKLYIYTYQLFMCEPGNIQHTKLYIYTYQLFMCEHGNIQHTKLYISISTRDNFSQYAYKLRRASVTSYLCVNLYCHVMHPLTHMEQAAEGCGSARIWSAVCGKRDKRHP